MALSRGGAGTVIAVFVAVLVGAILAPVVWDKIIGSPDTATNSTTRTFLDLVPVFFALGVMIVAIKSFL